ALLVLGGVVAAVLLQVTLVAGGGDAVDDFLSKRALEVRQLCLELVVSLLGQPDRILLARGHLYSPTHRSITYVGPGTDGLVVHAAVGGCASAAERSGAPAARQSGARRDDQDIESSNNRLVKPTFIAASTGPGSCSRAG